LRIEDYRFYGQLCLGFGTLLLIIGCLVAFFTTIFTTGVSPISTLLGPYFYGSPYVGEAIALVVMGIILIVGSQILFREWRIKSAETKQTLPHPPPLS
jgi:uncharacterized membrane protein